MAFELPGFGRSPENTRNGSLDDLAETIAQAVAAVGIVDYTLYGTSFGGAVALRLALAHTDRVRALVLESPAALRPEGWTPQALSPEQLQRALFVHPENAPAPEPPEVVQKQLALLGRLSGPNQDPDLMSGCARWCCPCSSSSAHGRPDLAGDRAALSRAPRQLQRRLRLRRCPRDSVRPAGGGPPLSSATSPSGRRRSS